MSHQDMDRRWSSKKVRKQEKAQRAQRRRRVRSRRAAKQQNNKLRYNSQYLLQALQWLLGSVDFRALSFRADCTWQPLQLAVVALLWAWSDEPTLGDRA